MSTFKSKDFSIVSSPSVISESRSYKQALKIPQWKKAMKNKIDALNAKNTQVVVPLPVDVSSITYKWVFSVKFLADRALDNYKSYAYYILEQRMDNEAGRCK